MIGGCYPCMKNGSVILFKVGRRLLRYLLISPRYLQTAFSKLAPLHCRVIFWSKMAFKRLQAAHVATMVIVIGVSLLADVVSFES